MKHIQLVLLSFVFVLLTGCGGGGGGDGTDNPPTASAGPDQTVNKSSLVTLAGSGSDAEGSVTLSWMQTAGTMVTLSSSTIGNPTFTAPSVTADEVLSFTLTVTDSAAQTATDSVLITVLANTAPVVSAGPDQTVAGGSVVTLAGSGSDAEGAVTFSWSQIAGTTVTLSDATITGPTFTAPVVATTQVLTFRLTVTDTDGATAFDDVSITIQGTTPPPLGYLFYTNSLNAVDPASPTTPSLIEPTANLVQTPGGFGATAEIIRTGDVDPVTHIITDEHNYAVIYPHTDGRIYKVSALSGSTLTPVQVSNESQADMICTGVIGGTAVRTDYENTDNSVFFYVLPGADTNCETDDDVWKMVRLSMGATDTPVNAKRFLLDFIDMSSGALNGWLAQDTLGTGELQTCNLNFTSCTKLRDVSSYVEWRVQTTFDHAMLEIDNQLFIFSESARTLSPARFTLPAGTFISVPDSDGSTVYFGHGTNLYQMPADGSANATVLQPETQDIIRVLATTNSVVYLLATSGSGTQIKSVVKAGGTPVSLSTAAAGEDLFLLFVKGNKVYFNHRIFTISPIFTITPVKAGVINDDATGLTEYADAAWNGATFKTTYDADLAFNLSELLVKTYLIEGYDLPGTNGGISGATIKAVDTTTGTVGITVGTIPDTDKTTSLTCFGYGDDALCSAVVEFVPAPPLPALPFQQDVYYLNAATANSLQRVTNTDGENEVPLY